MSTIAIISVIVAFSVIFSLNRETRAVGKSVTPLQSVGIAFASLVCVATSLSLAGRWFDLTEYGGGVAILAVLVVAVIAFHLVRAIFHRIADPEGSESDIHICYGGDIDADWSLASLLQTELMPSAPADVQMYDIHEFERDEGVDTPPDALGTFVYVISEPFVRDADIRRKLLRTAQKSDLPGYMYFFVLRGTTYEALREAYPDMEELGNRVMVGTDSDLRRMCGEIIQWVRRRPLVIKRLRRFARTKFWLSTAGVIAGIALPWVYGATPLVWFLLVLSARSPTFNIPAPHVVLALASFQFVALLLHRQRAVDFWPFLGACMDWDSEAGLRRRTPLFSNPYSGFWSWVAETKAKRHANRTHVRHLDSEGLGHSLHAWFDLIRLSRRYTAIVFFGGIFAILFFAPQLGKAWPDIAWGAALGAVIPQWVSWAQRFTKRIGYWRVGLSDKELMRTSRFFQSHQGDKQLIGNLSLSSHRMHRSWQATPPRIFISYSWTADERHGHAPALHRVLAELGIDHFYDKDSIRSRFASWRASVSDALMQCTHVFVLLDKSMPASQVVDREIETVVQRLYTDIAPSIICVADQDTMEHLLKKEDLSAELRWLVEWAPRISPREAQIPDVISSVIRQRSRQGRLRDFLTLCLPGSHLKRSVGRKALAVPLRNDDGHPPGPCLARTEG